MAVQRQPISFLLGLFWHFFGNNSTRHSRGLVWDRLFLLAIRLEIILLHDPAPGDLFNAHTDIAKACCSKAVYLSPTQLTLAHHEC